MNVDTPSGSNNNAGGALLVKRKRVTKACLVCAKSRRKCDGVQPTCGTCATQGAICAWSDVPTRRGPPKGYRRGTADPASLVPKIAKIREHVQALQVAYGDAYVLDQLHRALFDGCEHWVIAGVSKATEAQGDDQGESSAHKDDSEEHVNFIGRSPVEEWTGTKSHHDEEMRHDEASSEEGGYPVQRKSDYRTADEQDDGDDDGSDSEGDELEGISSGKAFLANSMRYMSRGGSLSPPAQTTSATFAHSHSRYTVNPAYSSASSLSMALHPLTPVSDSERYTPYPPTNVHNHHLHTHPQGHSLVHRSSHGNLDRYRRHNTWPAPPPSIASSMGAAPSTTAPSEAPSSPYHAPSVAASVSRDHYGSTHERGQAYQQHDREAHAQHQAHLQQHQHFHRYHSPGGPVGERSYGSALIDAGGGSSGNNGRVTTHGGLSAHGGPSVYAPSEGGATAGEIPEQSVLRGSQGRAMSEATSAPDTYRTPQPSPNEVEILLKTYWSAIHPHWPILYKPWYDAISIFNISEKVPHALLYIMYALAARLAPTDSLNGQVAEGYKRIAEAELQANGPFQSHINKCEALFLLSIYYQGEGNQRQAWVLSGLAAMMAFDLGLHKAKRGLPLVENEQRIRVFWNIYVYEKVLAAEMGRPVMIRIVHCDPQRLSEEQADEYDTLVRPAGGSPVVLHTISIFNAAVDLFSILERILNAIHTVTHQLPSRSAREKLVADLDRDLLNWQKTIGPRCTYPRQDDTQPTRTRFLTHAWYHVAMILLHRPFIPRHREGQVFVSNVHHQRATEHANQLVDLLAQFAAGAEIDKLPPNDAYLIFTAAVIQVFNLGSEDRARRDDARPRLEKCIEWLRGLAETWSAASQYKHLLDAFSQVASNSIMSSHAQSPTILASTSHSAGSSKAAVHKQDQNQTQPNAMAYQSSVVPRSHSQSQTQSHIQPHQAQEQHHVMTYDMQSQSQIRSAHSPPTHGPMSSVADVSMSASTSAVQTDQPGEASFHPPGIFPIESYYWNDFQAAGMQQHQMPGAVEAYQTHAPLQPQPQAQPQQMGEIGVQYQENGMYSLLLRALGDRELTQG